MNIPKCGQKSQTGLCDRFYMLLYQTSITDNRTAHGRVYHERIVMCCYWVRLVQRFVPSV